MVDGVSMREQASAAHIVGPEHNSGSGGVRVPRHNLGARPALARVSKTELATWGSVQVQVGEW